MEFTYDLDALPFSTSPGETALRHPTACAFTVGGTSYTGSPMDSSYLQDQNLVGGSPLSMVDCGDAGRANTLWIDLAHGTGYSQIAAAERLTLPPYLRNGVVGTSAGMGTVVEPITLFEVGADTPSSDGSAVISGGASHTCAISMGGSLFCWGDYTANQLSAPLGRDFVQVNSGDKHSCAIHGSDGSIECCWDGSQGQVSDTPPGTGFTQVTAGSLRSCALCNDGTVACWGYGGAGETAAPPANDFKAVTAGTHHSCGLHGDGSLECWAIDVYAIVADAPTGPNYSAVSSGSSFACALRRNGNPTCWGENFEGQVSSTPILDRFTEISAGDIHTCGLKADGGITCWGGDFEGQVSSTPTATGFTSIGAADMHTCATRADGTLACWGADFAGESSGIPTELQPDSDGDGITDTNEAALGTDPSVWTNLVDGALGGRAATGSAGQDLIYAVRANTSVSAGEGNDVVVSALGRQVITLGGGQDRVVWNHYPDSDVIADFTFGEDRLDLRGLLSAIGFGGSDPFAGGHVSCTYAAVGAAYLRIDRDGLGGLGATNYALVKGLGATPDFTLCQPGNFLF